MDTAAREQAKSFELRAATALSNLLAAGGRRAEARAILAPVVGWFTEGHATLDMIAARRTLESLE